MTSKLCDKLPGTRCELEEQQYSKCLEPEASLWKIILIMRNIKLYAEDWFSLMSNQKSSVLPGIALVMQHIQYKNIVTFHFHWNVWKIYHNSCFKARDYSIKRNIEYLLYETECFICCNLWTHRPKIHFLFVRYKIMTLQRYHKFIIQVTQ